ncbi:MAG: hypothetical protein AVDCRST_MAG15-1142, partial [uncultured Rubellimicrobium sp.]
HRGGLARGLSAGAPQRHALRTGAGARSIPLVPRRAHGPHRAVRGAAFGPVGLPCRGRALPPLGRHQDVDPCRRSPAGGRHHRRAGLRRRDGAEPDQPQARTLLRLRAPVDLPRPDRHRRERARLLHRSPHRAGLLHLPGCDPVRGPDSRPLLRRQALDRPRRRRSDRGARHPAHPSPL